MPTVIEQPERAVEAFNSNFEMDDLVKESSNLEIDPDLDQNQDLVVDLDPDHKELVNEEALMIENMQLVDVNMKTKMHVPNHLLESKIFAKVGQNAFIQSRPSIINYNGFEVGQKHFMNISILNASSDVLRMHIIPPQTKYFSIQYKKPDRMVAGTTLKCTVVFVPDEWRYYYDCIRIHCPGEDNLVIPIHGYPIMSTKDFPRNYTFKSVPVGESITKSFPLKCMAPIDFEFNIKHIQYHPAFAVEPTSGIVPANSQVEINVTFSPLEFQTATLKIELNISQFNSKGIECTFVGSSKPGMLQAKTLSFMNTEVLDPTFFSPLDRGRSKRQTKKTQTSTRALKSAPVSSKNETSLPKDLYTPHGVTKILIRDPEKLKINQMNLNLLEKGTSASLTRQVKEAMFDQALRKNVYDERQNQLRWQVKLGEDLISAEKKAQILQDRNIATNIYSNKKQGGVTQEEEYERVKTDCLYRRTRRDCTEVGSGEAKFDIYTNDLWAVRHSALTRFVQAARLIIIRNRANKMIPDLRKMKSQLAASQQTDQGSTNDESQEQARLSTDDMSDPDFTFKKFKIESYKFPTYKCPNTKDDMDPDALGNVPTSHTDLQIKMDVPFFNLKVPHYYKLYNYTSQNTHKAASGYVPKTRTRALRVGAEDEIIKLSEDVAEVVSGEEMKGGPTTVSVTTATGEVVTVHCPPATDSLTPPEALFKPIDYPSLHIMNPAPGMQVFKPPVEYSEVDFDYHLNPLPKYPKSNKSSNKADTLTQKQFLDREDTIKGIMGWKKFPSQSLTSLSNLPTLSNVWIPRWDDAFNPDFLPEEVPTLLKQLPDDDAENVLEQDEEAGVVNLTPEMVNTQFALVDSAATLSQDNKTLDQFPEGNKIPSSNVPSGQNGPLSRDVREQELEYFLTKKYNKLGSKLDSNVKVLNELTTNENLILK